MQFRAKLALDTPRIALEHDGQELPLGVPRPAHGGPGAGEWIPKLKTLSELLEEVGSRLRVRERSADQRLSQFGPMPEDGGDCLVALLAYRRIVEGRGTAAEKAASLAEFVASNDFARRHFPAALGD
jgi:hypothetical protein